MNRGTRRSALSAILLLLASAAWSCATTKRAPVVEQPPCPFLGPTLCGELVPGAENQPGLRYINPNAHWTQYNKVLVSPVTFWGGAESSVPVTDQQALTNY